MIPNKVRQLALKHHVTIRRDDKGVYAIWRSDVPESVKHPRYSETAAGARARIRDLVRWYGERRHGKNPAKLERCVEEVKRRRGRGRKKVRSAYGVCKASIAGTTKRRRRRNPAPYFVAAHRHGGKWLVWTGKHFTANNDESGSFKTYASSDAARSAAVELWRKHPKIGRAGFALYVIDRSKIRKVGRLKNPSRRESVDAAAQKFEDFTGHQATHVERAPARSKQRTGWTLGRLRAVEYDAKRDGENATWRHPFKSNSRPLLATSTDGKQLHIVGGRYEVTDAGIEDR